MYSGLLCFALKFPLANSIEPDQAPRSVASEMGMHSLHMSAYLVSSLKRVKRSPKWKRNSPTKKQRVVLFYTAVKMCSYT